MYTKRTHRVLIMVTAAQVGVAFYFAGMAISNLFVIRSMHSDEVISHESGPRI